MFARNALAVVVDSRNTRARRRRAAKQRLTRLNPFSTGEAAYALHPDSKLLIQLACHASLFLLQVNLTSMCFPARNRVVEADRKVHCFALMFSVDRPRDHRKHIVVVDRLILR